jgi:hypothetical protein
LHIRPFLFHSIGKNWDNYERIGPETEWNGISLQASINNWGSSFGAGNIYKNKYGLRYQFSQFYENISYQTIHNLGLTLRFFQKENKPADFEKRGAF